MHKHTTRQSAANAIKRQYSAALSVASRSTRHYHHHTILFQKCLIFLETNMTYFSEVKTKRRRKSLLARGVWSAEVRG